MRWTVVLACALAMGCDGGTDAKGETDVEDTESTTETDTTPVDDTEEPADTEEPGDTDEPEVPFSRYGDWTLTGGAISARAEGAWCPPIGEAANSPERTMIWTEGTPSVINLSSFTQPYECTGSGDTVTCTTGGVFSDRGSYQLGYDYPVTITVHGDQTITLSQRTDATCLSGDCNADYYCSSYTTTWTGTHD